MSTKKHSIVYFKRVNFRHVIYISTKTNKPAWWVMGKLSEGSSAEAFMKPGPPSCRCGARAAVALEQEGSIQKSQ